MQLILLCRILFVPRANENFIRCGNKKKIKLRKNFHFHVKVDLKRASREATASRVVEILFLVLDAFFGRRTNYSDL